MISPTPCFGFDVSSTELCLTQADPFTLNTAVKSIPNTAPQILRWLKTVPAGCRIGMEATGTFHRLLADLAHQAGHTVFVLNPAHVATYLRSLRARGKSDVLDTRGIARYVLNEGASLHPYTPPTALQDTLALLIHRRHQFVKQRQSLRMSMAGLSLCKPQFDVLIQSFDALLAELDARITQTIAQDTELQAQRQRLCTICGIGPLVSASLTARLSRIPYANSDAFVAAYGMDPRPRDSGQYVGRRVLSKHGNPEDRRLIYLAAVSACNNPEWLAMRDKLVARGLSKIAAYCVIARKLLRIAFAVWTSKSSFDPQRLRGACAAP